MDTGVIYALFDPKTHLCRYVGQTYKKLGVRVIQHLRASDRTKRSEWIENLRRRGLRPEVKILEQVPLKYLDEAEMFWIYLMRHIGMPLTNITHMSNKHHHLSRRVVIRMDKEKFKQRKESKIEKKVGFLNMVIDKTCTICTHPKGEIINSAIHERRWPGVISAQFKLDRVILLKHIDHLRSSSPLGTDNSEHCARQGSNALEERYEAVHAGSEPLEAAQAAPTQSMPRGEASAWSLDLGPSPLDLAMLDVRDGLRIIERAVSTVQHDGDAVDAIRDYLAVWYEDKLANLLAQDNMGLD